MDNVTHTLTAVMLSRAGLNRFHPRASLVLILAANAPDVDIVSWFGGPLSYLDHHRGITHSLLFLPVMASLAVLITAAVRRSLAGWKAAFGLALIGAASHLLLDWTNSYAVRPFLPFNGAWYHLDCNFVFDPWIWAVLLIAFVGPLLGRLVSTEIGAKPGSGRGLAVFALVFFAGFDFWRLLMHQRALATLDSRIYEGSAPISVAAFPEPASPMRWLGWVEGETFSRRFDMDLSTSFDPTAGKTFYKPKPSPALEAARQTEEFQRFLRFSLYPLWSVTPADQPDGASLVRITDQRFGFGVSAIVDRDNHVLRAWAGF